MGDVPSTVKYVSGLETTAPGELMLAVYHQEGMRTIRLAPGSSVIVGRAQPADVVVPDSTVSRQHAQFTWDGAKLEVEDLGATNGISINGKPVELTAIAAPDDVIKLGSARVIVSAQPLARRPASLSDEGGLICESDAMREVVRTAARVAQAEVSVLVVGETGSGKEVVAHTIHQRSSRSAAPLIAVNCASIPQNLVESTLFGHEKGAFTGATHTAKGVFEEAHTGTLFLDEVGELPLATQAALLRVLETKTVTRVGSRKEIPVDVRLVTATHRDLEAMCENGEFRLDLLFRLNTMVIHVAPLRERPADIDALAHHFLDLAARKHGRAVDLGSDAIALLQSYDWPGNVRELRNEMERAAILVEGPTVTASGLSQRLRGVSNAVAPTREFERTRHDLQHMATIPPSASDASFKEIIAQREREVLLQAYRQADGNQSEAARILKMPIRSFNYKFKILCGDIDTSKENGSSTR